MAPTYVQQTFDALLDDPLARSLRETTFVVVDLETTGGAPETCGHHRDRRGEDPRRGGAGRA